MNIKNFLSSKAGFCIKCASFNCENISYRYGHRCNGNVSTIKKIKLFYYNIKFINGIKGHISNYLFAYRFKKVLSVKSLPEFAALYLFVKQGSYYYNIKLTGSWTGLEVVINGYTFPKKFKSKNDSFESIIGYIR